MAAFRYQLIQESFWQWLGPAYKGLDADLKAVETTLASGGGAGGGGDPVELPAGLPIILRPNAEGTWTGVLTERIPGAVYWWQRAITPTTNAPVPTFGNGYIDGDMVDPLNEGETLPTQGI